MLFSTKLDCMCYEKSPDEAWSDQEIYGKEKRTPLNTHIPKKRSSLKITLLLNINTKNTKQHADLTALRMKSAKKNVLLQKKS